MRNIQLILLIVLISAALPTKAQHTFAIDYTGAYFWGDEPIAFKEPLSNAYTPSFVYTYLPQSGVGFRIGHDYYYNIYGAYNKTTPAAEIASREYHNTHLDLLFRLQQRGRLSLNAFFGVVCQWQGSEHSHLGFYGGPDSDPILQANDNGQAGPPLGLEAGASVQFQLSTHFLLQTTLQHTAIFNADVMPHTTGLKFGIGYAFGRKGAPARKAALGHREEAE